MKTKFLKIADMKLEDNFENIHIKFTPLYYNQTKEVKLLLVEKYIKILNDVKTIYLEDK
jgi:hypothetical protein